jgi:hypothetical protein
MRFDSLFRFLFIVYCVEAGVFLLFSPWSLFWERGIVQVPLPALRTLLLSTFARGGVTGFGLVHLIWGAHDVDAWWRERRTRVRAESAV